MGRRGARACTSTARKSRRDSSQSGAVVHSDRPLYVGYGDNGYTSYYDMDGAIDDVRVYEPRTRPATRWRCAVRGAHASSDSDGPNGRDTATPTPTDTTTPTPTTHATRRRRHRHRNATRRLQPRTGRRRWAFAETGGTTVADSAGGNDGFVRGSPTLDAGGVFDTLRHRVRSERRRLRGGPRCCGR
ncbi:MAG: hypothetical protein U5K28_05285 [Halobacteriales archaeon]|nr:hypothetical protein [Halobacteriales archaeon]